MGLTETTSASTDRPPPPDESRHEAEIRRILRQNDLVFRLFMLCGVVVCFVILLAMLVLMR